MNTKNIFAATSSAAVLVTGGDATHVAMSEDISIACYEDEVPHFIEPELERLYGNIFSSLVQFRTSGGLLWNTSTYIVRKGDEIVTIFLFRCEKGKVNVINEGMKIDSEEISRFAHYIFTTYRSATAITFHAVHIEIRKFPFPYQLFNCTEDIVLTLPATPDAYIASLAKTTRRNIKYYLNRVRRNFPSFRYDAYINDAVDEQHIRSIIGFNKARMAGKNKVTGIDCDEEQRTINLVKECGLVGVVTIDGRICAGAIGCHVGTNYFMSMIAHDPEYDDYRIGTLCCYLTICECIARGYKEFHFMWGRFEYKFILGGVLQNLDHLVLYRSPLHQLLNGRMAARIALKGYMHNLKFALLDKARKQDSAGFTSKLIIRSLNHLRRLKQSRAGLLALRK